MSKRFKQKGAEAGLRAIQTLGAVAVPNTLEEVLEENETEHEKQQPFGTDDWKNVEKAVSDVFRGNFCLSEFGIVHKIHQSIRHILRSRSGTFLNDCYKDWITKEMNMLSRKLWNCERSEMLKRLEEIWLQFYRNTLPLLEAVFYMLKPKGRLSTRGTTLMAFRDVMFFSENIEDCVKTESQNLSSDFKQMVLILYSVVESYPPSKNRLRLESIAAAICNTFLGYQGLYEKGRLTVLSNEPATLIKRRPSEVGPRRISRPFSVQPQQMETLRQLFRNAVKHKTTRAHKESFRNYDHILEDQI